MHGVAAALLFKRHSCTFTPSRACRTSADMRQCEILHMCATLTAAKDMFAAIFQHPDGSLASPFGRTWRDGVPANWLMYVEKARPAEVGAAAGAMAVGAAGGEATAWLATAREAVTGGAAAGIPPVEIGTLL